MKEELLTDDEVRMLNVVRYNKLVGRIQKKARLGRLHLKFEWRSSSNLWGRFGGGWQWAVGFKASSRSIVIHLFICYVSLHLARKEEQ